MPTFNLITIKQKFTKEISYATFDKNLRTMLLLNLDILEHVEVSLSAISSSVPILFKPLSHSPCGWPNIS